MKQLLYKIAIASLLILSSMVQKSLVLPESQDTKDLNRISEAGAGTGTTIIT